MKVVFEFSFADEGEYNSWIRERQVQEEQASLGWELAQRLRNLDKYESERLAQSTGQQIVDELRDIARMYDIG